MRTEDDLAVIPAIAAGVERHGGCLCQPLDVIVESGGGRLGVQAALGLEQDQDHLRIDAVVHGIVFDAPGGGPGLPVDLLDMVFQGTGPAIEKSLGVEIQDRGGIKEQAVGYEGVVLGPGTGG